MSALRRAEFDIIVVPAEFPRCTAHEMNVGVVSWWREHPERVDTIVHHAFVDRGLVFAIPCAPGHEREQPLWELDGAFSWDADDLPFPVMG